MPENKPTEIEQARSADVDPGTFDSSVYKELRKHTSHDEIMEAMQPNAQRHGVGIPLEHLLTALVNNNGDYDYAVPEAESYLDSDLLQTQLNHRQSRTVNNGSSFRTMLSGLLSQEDHDAICDSLSSHHEHLASRPDTLPESSQLFDRVIGSSGFSPSDRLGIIDRVEDWNSKDYPGAHHWIQSEIARIKSGHVMTIPGIENPQDLSGDSRSGLFRHIHKIINDGGQLDITYRGNNDFAPRVRSIVPTYIYHHPKYDSLYIRAYDPHTIDENGNKGSWRTFRGDRVSAVSGGYGRNVEVPDDPDEEEIRKQITFLHQNNGLTSMIPHEMLGSHHCSCGSTDGLHTLDCYQKMSSRLIDHYTAQLFSSCYDPGKQPISEGLVSPSTVGNFISTRRKLDAAINVAESGLFPYSYDPDRHKV